MFSTLDYQTCIKQARLLNNYDKIISCPNFKYVFHAELEINLNWNFHNSLERWHLIFTEISLPVCFYNDFDKDDHSPVLVFNYPPDKLMIYHNAKIKYRCLDCRNEWTSARGRAIFQLEFPSVNKYNCLFVSLCTQQCRRCHRYIEPSWYVCEAARVMENVCRIIIDKFYSHQNFKLSIDQEFFTVKEYPQRASQPHGRHQKELCQACREGYCYQ